MNRVAGAIGTLQFDYLPGIVDAHRANGIFFHNSLSGIPGLELLRPAFGSVPSFWVYCFLCERRDDLLRRLRQNGIYASKVHIRNDGYSCFHTGLSDLPGVSEFAAKEICIPCGWWVTEEDRNRIAETIRQGW
jgi:dTDP-4-amino-4,6-dideoxygalactose transaminase